LIENLLRSYVETFLEEEIRMETLIRKIGIFGNFLRLAAEMSGRILSFRELSQDLGVTHHTILSFYEILHDCMIVEKIPPLIPSKSRRRLSKASKYLFFDIGIRNSAAQLITREGANREEWSQRFEEWIGLSLIRYLRSQNLQGSLYYWRDHNGPELDWVVEYENRILSKSILGILNYFWTRIKTVLPTDFLFISGKDREKWSKISLPYRGLIYTVSLSDRAKLCFRIYLSMIGKTISHYKVLENIRGEERYKKLMERVKYEWETFKV